MATSTSVDEAPPSSVFLPILGSEGNLIPPAPQSPFAFHTLSTMQQEPYRSPEGLYFDTRSAASTSRSCSPSNRFAQASSAPSDYSVNSTAQSTSPSSSLLAYGVPVLQAGLSSPQTWRCVYPGCTSLALFVRGCDLRKHFNRHSKHLICRLEDCLQSITVQWPIIVEGEALWAGSPARRTWHVTRRSTILASDASGLGLKKETVGSGVLRAHRH